MDRFHDSFHNNHPGFDYLVTDKMKQIYVIFIIKTNVSTVKRLFLFGVYIFTNGTHHTNYYSRCRIKKLNSRTEPVINITDLKNEAKLLRAEIIEIRMEIAELKEILLLREQEIRSKQRGKTERKFI